jgi:hypothetical protein
MPISDVYFPVKQLTTETDNRAWYEKLEDYEGDFEFVDEDGEDGESGKKNNRIEDLYTVNFSCGEWQDRPYSLC